MRRRYRRRSTVSLVLWGLLFSAGVVMMAWQFGWFPAQIDLLNLAGHDHQDGEHSGNKSTEKDTSESHDADTIVFADDNPAPLDENEVYARLVEQARKRSASQMSGEANRTASPLPRDNSVKPSVRSNLPPLQEGTRAAANPAVRNSLYLRPQNLPSGSAGDSRSEIVQAGNSVSPSQAAHQADAIRSVPSLPEDVHAKIREADLMLQDGLHLSAHRELSRLYWNYPELRTAFQDRIDDTALPIYFSPQPHFMSPYQVQPGDQLRRVAGQYQISWEYIEKLNRIDARRIRPGQELKVIKGPFSAIVELSRFELTVHAHGYYVRKYPVGIGRDGATPVGRFTVLNKVVNPQYTDPDNRVIHADDPGNPLGERWLDLGNGYGIHGTIEPNTIGQADSRGCIRLKNADVEEVYDLLEIGSVVEIRR